MNKKGFTLIELMATIAILAIVVLIAVPSINGISASVRKSSRNNLIKSIEISASKYAYDSGIEIAFVDELVVAGYLQSDNNGDVIDPLSNERLNCYLVEMTKEGDHYKATFKDGVNYEKNGNCDISNITIDSKEININVYNNGTIVNDITKWIKGEEISLEAVGAVENGIEINCSVDKCVWNSTSGLRKEGVSELILNNIIVQNGRYTFQIQKKDNEGKINIYTESINIKVDNEAPVIYENEIVVKDKYDLGKKKSVTIEASDGNGSGISGYYLGKKENNKTCNNVEYQESKEFIEEIKSNGDYLICVKDNVGNISQLELKGIMFDNTGPEFTFGLDGNTAIISCNDPESGIPNQQSSWEEELSGTSDAEIIKECTNGAGITVQGKHTYKYNDCLTGSNTCQYGCDTCNVYGECTRTKRCSCTSSTCDVKGCCTTERKDICVGSGSVSSSGDYKCPNGCLNSTTLENCACPKNCEKTTVYTNRAYDCGTETYECVTGTENCRCSSCKTGSNTCKGGFILN